MADNIEHTTRIQGMRYALLIMADVPRGKYRNLQAHIVRDVMKEQTDILFTYRSPDQWVLLGNVTVQENAVLDLHADKMKEMAATLKLIKE